MREGWKGGEERHWNGEECPSDGRAEGREGGTGGEEMEVVRGKSRSEEEWRVGEHISCSKQHKYIQYSC